MFDGTMIWFASLATLPAPTGPVRVTLEPMAGRMFFTLSKTSGLPATMMARVPSGDFVEGAQQPASSKP
jgi:hypothetical protein